MYARLFKGTGDLTKLIFRQQRFKIIIWLIGLIGVTLAAAAAYPDIYPDEQSRQAFALTMDNPAMVAMLGVGYEVYSTIGTLFAHEMLLFTAIAVAVMNILLAGQSTGSDEEDGRTEVILSLPVGRLAYLYASVIVVVATNLLLALLLGGGLLTLGIEGMNAESSFLYGVVLGATGLVFGSFTALFAQLAETSRESTMLSFVFLISAYLVRAVGDVSNETLSLFSPLGWTVRTDVFAMNNWWPVYAALLLSIVIIGIAFYLNGIRDLGSGFIPARKGRKHASAFLQTPLGFIFRLQRTSIIAWAIGLFALSASFGAILGDLETYFADIEIMQAFLTEDTDNSMTEQFIKLLMAIMALISTIPAVMTVLNLKGQENKDLMEHFFSRSVSRTRMLGSYFILAIIVSFIMQSFVAIGFWSVGVTVMEDALLFSTTYWSALVYLPAMWVVIGLSALFVGATPKITGFVWFYVIYCFVVLYLQGLLDFPEWLINLSVFEHIPQIPAEEMSVMAIINLIAIAVIITVIGFIGYNKRDIKG